MKRKSNAWARTMIIRKTQQMTVRYTFCNNMILFFIFIPEIIISDHCTVHQCKKMNLKAK